jgi:hypothetical protein
MESTRVTTFKNSRNENELTELLEQLAQPRLQPEQAKSLFSKIRAAFENFKRRSAPQSGGAGSPSEARPAMNASLLDAHQKIACTLDSLEASSPETQQWQDNVRLLRDQLKKC